jgi:membrane protein
MSAKQLFVLTKQAATDWSEDNATRLAAALAFYTMLSIAPLLIICIKICGVVFGQETASGQVKGYVQNVAGAKAAQAAQDMMASASQSGSGVVATTISVLVLIFSASGVFGELQTSLNTIWEVKPKPNRGIMDIVKERLFSFAMVMVVAFLLLVSMVVSAAISGVSNYIAGDVAWLWEVINFAISIVVITGMVALMFKYIPDANVRWGDVIHGAIFTAVLFTIGKFALGWYLGRATTTSVYGAAGSLVALLLWVYYSSLIVFFGAEFTQAYGRAKHPVAPTENAQKLTDMDRLQQGMAPSKVAPPAATISCPTRPIERLGWSTPKTMLLTAAGMATGAVLARFGLQYTELGQQSLRRRMALHNRIEDLAAEMGDVKKYELRARAANVHEHLHHIERQIKQHATLGDLFEARMRAREALPMNGGRTFVEKVAQSAVQFVKGAVKG